MTAEGDIVSIYPGDKPYNGTITEKQYRQLTIFPLMLEALETIAAGNTDPDEMVEIAAAAVYQARYGNTQPLLQKIDVKSDILGALETVIAWAERTGIADNDPPEYLQGLAAIAKAQKEK